MPTPLSFTPEQYIIYKEKLLEELHKRKVDVSNIKDILLYSDSLQNNKLPIIFDQDHLAGLLGYDLEYLQVLSTCKEDFYKEYKVPKKNGRWRIIHEPFPNLKEIQSWILNNILMSPGVLNNTSFIVSAFVPGRNILYNATPHVGKKVVISMDIKDFFTSVKWIQIYSVFSKLGYGKDVSGMLTHLCTLNNCLPQGAPTSPMLSNMVMKRADEHILAFCRDKNITYTRYADDLTFSLGQHYGYGKIIGYVKSMLCQEGFLINDIKTKVYQRNHSQIVTGVVVNEFPQVAKSYRKKIRQEMFYLQKFGLSSHCEKIEYAFDKFSYLKHLLGKINYVLNINPKDKQMESYRVHLKEMMKAARS